MKTSFKHGFVKPTLPGHCVSPALLTSIVAGRAKTISEWQLLFERVEDTYKRMNLDTTKAMQILVDEEDLADTVCPRLQNST